MLPSACSIDRHQRTHTPKLPRWRTVALWATALCVAVVATAATVASQPAQSQSGWAIGIPTPTVTTAAPTDPKLQSILRQVLEPTHVPRLAAPRPAPSQPATPQIDEHSNADERPLVDERPHVVERPHLVERSHVAKRPSAIGGWRSTGLRLSPLLNSTSQHTAPAASPADASDQQSDPNALPPSPTFDDESTREAAPHENAHSHHAVQFRPPIIDHVTEDAAQSSNLPDLTRAGDSAVDPSPDLDESAPDDLAPTPDLALPYGDLPPSGDLPRARDLPAFPADEPTSPDDASEVLADDAEDHVAESADPSLPDAEFADGPMTEESPDAGGELPDAGAEMPSLQLPAQKPAPPPLTRQLMNLRARVRSVLKGYYRKPLNSREHDPWEVMHGMLSYGLHSRILQNSPRGEPITAIGWLCYNQPCKRKTLLYVTPEGELRAKHGVGLQGHMGQLLAMLAQCNVSPDYPIHVGKNEFTIHDLIEAEKKTCYPKSELTFKLIALQHYLDLNERWVNDQGLEWDFPRLIREELAQPIRGAACGGTHRLAGLSLVVKTRQRRGEPLDGEYARAFDFVQRYHNYAFRLQNRDGSLSTKWFNGRGDEDDDDRRIQTTGHILEWLCYSLSDEELRQQRTIRAVWYLASLMYTNYGHDWEIGPRSHAIHALVLYDQRVFQPFDRDSTMASFLPQPSTANRSPRRPTGRR